MSILDERAKNYICPFIVSRVEKAHQPNAMDQDGLTEIREQSPCLGSRCMAWRRDRAYPSQGYCGMAGKEG